MEHPVPVTSLPEAAQKALRGAAPLKMMAARGMAPLPPVALVSVLYALAYDGDEKLAEPARATLGKLPPPLLDGALSSAELPPAVLDDLASRSRGRNEVLTKIVQHPAVAVETVLQVAREANEALCELIATNEQRLIANPALIEALYMNRYLRMSTADRILELAARNGVTLEIPGFREVVQSLQNELIIESDEPTPEDLEFRATIDADEVVEGEDVVEVDQEGEETVKERFAAEEKRLEKMTISQKVRAAILGTTSQRLLLARSTNRVVARAAIMSPKNQQSEAEMLSASRQVCEDVLREIARRKEWVGKYTIKRNLVFNPKTPVSISLGMLSHLRDSDLKALAKSKNVSQAIKTIVAQILAKRAPKS
jgi:hypothetical protein